MIKSLISFLLILSIPFCLLFLTGCQISEEDNLFIDYFIAVDSLNQTHICSGCDEYMRNMICRDCDNSSITALTPLYFTIVEGNR